MHWRCSLSDSPWCDFCVWQKGPSQSPMAWLRCCSWQPSQSWGHGVFLVDACPASQATFPPGKNLLVGFVLNQFQIQNRPLQARQRSELGIERCGFFEGFSWCLTCWGCLLLREALSSGEAGVLVTLELAVCGVGLLCCKGGGLTYMTKIPVIILLLVWMHVHFFHLVHPAVLIFRADAVCGLKYPSGLWWGRSF